MQELLDFIITSIVGEEIDYEITETETEEGIEFSVVLPEAVSGRVIGKGGQNIKAIRDVVNILARKQEKRIFIKIRN